MLLMFIVGTGNVGWLRHAHKEFSCDHTYCRMLTWAGMLLSHPTAFLIVVCYVGIWLVFNPKTFDWQAAATVATWVMTLFIQRAEHRDTQAIHAKLDELLRVEGRARSDLIWTGRSRKPSNSTVHKSGGRKVDCLDLICEWLHAQERR